MRVLKGVNGKTNLLICTGGHLKEDVYLLKRETTGVFGGCWHRLDAGPAATLAADFFLGFS